MDKNGISINAGVGFNSSGQVNPLLNVNGQQVDFNYGSVNRGINNATTKLHENLALFADMGMPKKIDMGGFNFDPDLNFEMPDIQMQGDGIVGLGNGGLYFGQSEVGQGRANQTKHNWASATTNEKLAVFSNYFHRNSDVSWKISDLFYNIKRANDSEGMNYGAYLSGTVQFLGKDVRVKMGISEYVFLGNKMNTNLMYRGSVKTQEGTWWKYEITKYIEQPVRYGFPMIELLILSSSPGANIYHDYIMGN